MSIENLLNKASYNCETGKWAEDKKYFDAAVSRYYYSLYEKIIYISKKRGFYVAPPFGSDSHNHIINEFRKNVASLVSPADLTCLDTMKSLKKCRREADYEECQICDLNQFNLAFKYFYNLIERVLNTLL